QGVPHREHSRQPQDARPAATAPHGGQRGGGGGVLIGGWSPFGRLRLARVERADADRHPETGESARRRCVGVAAQVHGTGVEAHEVVGRDGLVLAVLSTALFSYDPVVLLVV